MREIENNDLVKLYYVRDKGFITIESKDEVYLCDTRTHRFSILFPIFTFLTTLKCYTITNNSKDVELEGEEEKEVKEKAKNFKESPKPIMWGALGMSSLAVSLSESVKLNYDISFINKLTILLSIIILVCAKYYFHYRNLHRFGKDNHVDISSLKVRRIRIRYKDKRVQHKYLRFILFFNLLFFLAVLGMGILAYSGESAAVTLSFAITVWFYLFMTTSPKMIDGDRYLSIS